MLPWIRELVPALPTWAPQRREAGQGDASCDGAREDAGRGTLLFQGAGGRRPHHLPPRAPEEREAPPHRHRVQQP